MFLKRLVMLKKCVSRNYAKQMNKKRELNKSVTFFSEAEKLLMKKVVAGGTIILWSAYYFHIFRRESTERRQRILHFPTPFIYSDEKGITIIDYTGMHTYTKQDGKLTKEEIELRKEHGLRL